MVVRFIDSKSRDSQHRDTKGAGARNRGAGRGEADRDETGAEQLAPVTYLPGAKPTDHAERARLSVERAGRSKSSAARTGTQRDPDDPTDSANTGDASKDRGGKRAGARAANVSLHQLARRGMSRWELQQVLQRREVDDATATAELDRLESVGLLDDAALAVTLVYTQHTRKGLGRTAIAHELRRRHIDQEIIDDALTEIEDDDERERALELAHKRAGQLRGVDDETARRRLSGFLARKGYSNDIVRAAVDSALGSRGSGVRFQ